VAVAALVAMLTGLTAAPSGASSTASTGLSTGSSTAGAVAGRVTTPSAGPTGTTGAAPAAAGSSVVLTGYSPVVSADTHLRLTGRIQVGAAEPAQNLVVRVKVQTGGVASRAALDRVQADPTMVRYDFALTRDDLPAAGPDQAFTVDTELHLDRAALTIYPMQIGVYPAGASATAKPIAATYTFLVWAPKPAATAKAAPTYISTVLPISALPKLRSDWMLTDDTLADDVKPNGRLFRLLDAVHPTSGQRSAVALALDPTLLKALRVMAGEDADANAATRCTTTGGAPCYRFASPKGPQERPVDQNARTFLANLRAFANTPGNVVFALPWGDADLTALLHANQGGDANWAVKTGKVVVADALGRKDTSGLANVAYPGDGFADSATLAFLADPGVGTTTAVLDDRQLPVSRSSPVKTPTALTFQQTSTGPIRALAADSRLADVVTGPQQDGSGPGVWQTFGGLYAELAMITAERQSQGRQSALAVLALPRDWNPPAAWAGLLLGATVGYPPSANATFQPFFQPVALPAGKVTAAEVTGGTAAGGAVEAVTGAALATTSAARTTRGALVYPDSAAAREIPSSYVQAVEELRGQADLLGPVLCSRKAPQLGPAGIVTTPPEKCAPYRTVVKPMRDTLLSALSVRWRGDDRVGAVRLSQEVDGRINEIRDHSIGIFASAKVTLTSRDGTVPLTVDNISDGRGLDALPMTIILQLSSNDKTKLRSAARQSLTIEPGTKQQVEISVSSDAAGSFPVVVQVLTPDGKRLTAQPTRILVRSTAYGAIATAITYGAVGLFAAAVLLRLIRRRRRATAARGGPGAAPPTGPTAVSPPTGPTAAVDGTRTGPQATLGVDQPTMPMRRIQANAAGTQRTESERAYAGGVPANPSEP